MESYLNIQLDKPFDFLKKLQDELMANQQLGEGGAESTVDQSLASTPATFIISFDGKKFFYLEDFSFFFGYQINAFEQSENTGDQTEIVSFSGDKMLVRKDEIRFLTKEHDEYILTESSLALYFSNLMNILKCIASFLEYKGLYSEDLSDFEHRLTAILDRLPTC